jgi:hypothetical protein
MQKDRRRYFDMLRLGFAADRNADLTGAPVAEDPRVRLMIHHRRTRSQNKGTVD